MNLRQLEVFRATMRSVSITAAAKLLHISQPSVSRLISDLEESLGFSLFNRSGHGIIASVEVRRFSQSVTGRGFNSSIRRRKQYNLPGVWHSFYEAGWTFR
jgi:predicted transcriptional regulator